MLLLIVTVLQQMSQVIKKLEQLCLCDLGIALEQNLQVCGESFCFSDSALAENLLCVQYEVLEVQQ